MDAPETAWENLPAEHSEPPAALPCAEATGVAEISLPADTQFQSIYDLEAALLRLPQADVQTEHSFCNGLYARTMHIPAGTVLTGAVHKDESFFVVRKGHLIVTTDDGSAQVGPGFMSVTQANTKRAGVALTDVEVTTFHANPTNETDPQAIWDMYTVPAPAPVLEAVQHPHLEGKK